MLPPWSDGCTTWMIFMEDQFLTNQRKTCMLLWYMSCEMIMVLFSYNHINESILNLHINYPSTSIYSYNFLHYTWLQHEKSSYLNSPELSLLKIFFQISHLPWRKILKCEINTFEILWIGCWRFFKISHMNPQTKGGGTAYQDLIVPQRVFCL